jgi:branched-subunit amino acid aminotransferase/4-amino-4-deoxychorismate lyase
MLPRTAWVNGRLLPAEGPHLSAFDRGFQLGDGVFETLRARGRHVIELDVHLARLARSADGLAIPLPADAFARISGGIAEVLEAEGHDDAAIRITVSRGMSMVRGLLPPADGADPTVVIQAWPVIPPPSGHLDDGLHVVASSVRRDPANPLAALKTTSRADYVFARLEAERAGADDALFVTIDGHLSEATSANIFLIRRARELATPSVDCAILAGTTRDWLLGWASSVGLVPVQCRLSPADLAAADEAFVSSSVAGILPVTRWEGDAIGNGRPGAFTLRARADRERFMRERRA